MATTPRVSAGYKRAVGVFNSYEKAEAALHELKKTGFDMNRVSVVARDPDARGDVAGVDVKEKAVGNKADEGAATGAAAGGALGSITGLLVGLGVSLIPGVGPILLAGAGATALATTLAGTAIGAAAGGLVGALIGLGIPEERAKVYNERVAKGDYLVMLTGTQAEIDTAKKILHGHKIQDWGVYDAPDVANAATTTTTDHVTPTTTGHVTPTTTGHVTPTTTAHRTTSTKVTSDTPDVVIVDRRNEIHKHS